MSGGTVLTMARVEALHLADLVEQFVTLVADSSHGDPAVERLTPDAYPDDAAAGAEFRDAAREDLLARRSSDATTMLDGLRVSVDSAPSVRGSAEEDDTVDVALSDPEVGAWMRTLAAIRLVLASRLGITTEDDRDPDDPRFGVYDWIGYRLEGLIQATDPDAQGNGIV